MRTCFFEIRDVFYTNETGHQCETVDQMMHEAAVTVAATARDNAAHAKWGSVCVEVLENGMKVAVATVTVDVERMKTSASRKPTSET